MRTLSAWLLALMLGCDHDSNLADASAPVLPPLPPLPEMTELPSPSGTATRPPDGGTPCGAKGMPDCPLQGWMKKNMTPPMQAKDWQGIADSLERAALLAPPDAPDGGKSAYVNWVSIAKDGANAARAAEYEAIKAACRGCHEQYKAKYRAEMRLRPLP
jgi:hypothetical protein